MSSVFVICYETPVYAAPQVARTVYLHGSEASGPATAELTTPGNPHFIGPHRAVVYQRPAISWDASQSGLVVAPETNVHHVPRHVATAYNVDISLRQQIAADFSNAPAQAETNVHFVGRYQPAQHFLLQPYWQNVPLDQPVTVQPDTNFHFIGRYVATAYRLDPALRQQIAADFSSGTSFETNVHFVGKHAATLHRLWWPLWQNAALDVPATVQPETNPHFIAKFSATVYSVDIRLRSNVAADFSNPGPQPETNVHFIGPHRPTAYGQIFPGNSRDTTELDGPSGTVLPPVGGRAVVAHSFTRKRWRELIEELRQARSALEDRAEDAKPATRKALEKAAAAVGEGILALEFAPEGTEAYPDAEALLLEARALEAARSRAAVVTQTQAVLKTAAKILEDLEEEEAEMLLMFH